MKILKFVFLLCLSLASAAHAAGFTDQTGLRWELSSQKVEMQYASDLCHKVSIGGKPGRLPIFKELHELYRYTRPRIGWRDPNAPPLVEPPMDEQQLSNYQTTRKILANDGLNTELFVPIQNTGGEEIWIYGLLNARQQTMNASWQQYVLCVGKAAAKSAAKKEEPKNTTKSSPKPLGAILTKSTSGAKTPEQIAEQNAAKKANDKAAAKTNVADIVEENPYERFAASPDSWGHATNGWHVSHKFGKTRESACSAAIAAQSKWIASDEDKGFMKAAERTGCICGTYTRMGNTTFPQPQWTCGSYHKMKDTGKERGSVSR